MKGWVSGLSGRLHLDMAGFADHAEYDGPTLRDVRALRNEPIVRKMPIGRATTRCISQVKIWTNSLSIWQRTINRDTIAQ